MASPQEEDKMRARLQGLTITGLFLVLAACAPDAWRPDRPYESFLNKVSNTCYTKMIGDFEVGELINATEGQAATNSGWFLDQTSRLYYGELTRKQWLQSMQGFLDAKPTNEGVECLLGLLPDQPVPRPTGT
jgi:hypothetical protein